jgi:glutaredoxin 3
MECGGNPDSSGDTALDRTTTTTKAPSLLRSAGALQISVSHLPQLTAKLISPTEVIEEVALVIYTKPGCPYCQQARDYYNSKGIAFIDYDAQNDRARRAEMFKFSGDDPTVPCIVEDGKFVQSGWGDPLRG